MAIFNPRRSKRARKKAGDLLLVAVYRRRPKVHGDEAEEEEPGRGGVVLCEWPKCGSGQPPIMSTSKTRALMAPVCLQGGLLHTTVLQKQRQIYKTTIRKREKKKINQNAIKVE